MSVYWRDGTGVIAIDSKTMRRPFDRVAGKSALHVVTAFAADTRMTIGQVAAGDEGSDVAGWCWMPRLKNMTSSLES